MEIGPVNNPIRRLGQVGGLDGARKVQKRDPQGASPAYKLHLGEEAELALKIRHLVNESEDVRTRTVQLISHLIDTGRYMVDSQRIAEEILAPS